MSLIDQFWRSASYFSFYMICLLEDYDKHLIIG